MLRADHDLNLWPEGGVRGFAGGPLIVRRAVAPLGRCLPYRRAAGQAPTPGAAEAVSTRGWSVDLGGGGLGDILLGLAMVRALHEITGDRFELVYQGPRTALLDRCDLPVRTAFADTGHVIGTATANPVRFAAVPEQPPTWLDILDDDTVQVHSALPMRYYLQVEMATGCRLAATGAPAPAFTSTAVDAGHVVFIATTSMAARKDYGATRFAQVATSLAKLTNRSWACTLITPPDIGVDHQPWQGLPATILTGPDATDCVDVFANASLVIGNDTGLTHLAALTTRPDGTGPQVVGLYSRHAYLKWTTGAARHHSIATPLSQMLAAADRCPVRDRLDDALWNSGADLTMISADFVAGFAAARAGWHTS